MTGSPAGPDNEANFFFCCYGKCQLGVARGNFTPVTVQGIIQSVSEALSMKWNRRFRGLTMTVFNFGV